MVICTAVKYKFCHAHVGKRCSAWLSQSARDGLFPIHNFQNICAWSCGAASNYIITVIKELRLTGTKKEHGQHRSRDSTSSTNGATFFQKHEETQDVLLQHKGRTHVLPLSPLRNHLSWMYLNKINKLQINISPHEYSHEWCCLKADRSSA